eukprot:scaffold3428_cov21-Tisochrysis_lutea.AAC.3
MQLKVGGPKYLVAEAPFQAIGAGMRPPEYSVALRQTPELLTSRAIYCHLQVSHDQFLIESTVDELWLCENGTVAPWRGTFQEYKLRLKAMQQQQAQK